MDIEILREFIQAFDGLGEGAKEAFLWYLCFTELPRFILGLFLCSILLFAIARVYRIVKICSSSGRLYNAIGLYGEWSSSELNTVCEFLEAHRNEIKLKLK